MSIWEVPCDLICSVIVCGFIFQVFGDTFTFTECITSVLFMGRANISSFIYANIMKRQGSFCL